MKDNILFSVIVPVYNVIDYLEVCVTSILKQTYQNFELILVDDGSTDASSSLCDTYKNNDSRVRVIHKKNGGLVSARKAGCAIATGDYAVCVDSDDWIDKDHLLELSKVIEKHHPDIICFNFYEVKSETNNLKDIPFRKGLYSKADLCSEIYPQLIQNSKGGSFPPTIWAKAYKMHIYKQEQMCVNDQIKIGEDAACTIPCMFSAESIYILDKALYFYRRNNISMTKIRNPFSWDGPELIEDHLRQRVQSAEFGFQEQIARRSVHALITVVRTQFYRQDRYKVIVKDIKKQLGRSVYLQAIQDGKFNVLSATGMFHFFMKHNMFFPFFLLSKRS